MNERENFALVSRPPSTLEKAKPGAKRILSGMVQEALALASKERLETAEAKFRIGECELCEPDYRQVLLWAELMHGGLSPKTPSEIIKQLIKCETTIQDGRFIEVHWDDGSMWVKKFSFVPGLKIKVFHLWGGSDLAASISMDKNPALKMTDFKVSEINLEGLTELEKLSISMQFLKELDLRHTPRLKLLWCESNSLSQVNFAACQNLEEISVRNNFLERIDLSNLPALRSLHCDSNRLSHLGLSGVPALEFLDCRENRWGVGEYDQLQYYELCPIEVLDITPLKNLRTLRYDVGKTRLIQRPDQHF